MSDGTANRAETTEKPDFDIVKHRRRMLITVGTAMVIIILAGSYFVADSSKTLLYVIANTVGREDHAEHSGMAMGNGDLDLSTTQMSEQGLFHISYAPESEPIELKELHSWTLHVETADGEPVEGADIAVSYHMPEHEHGQPTQPEVTEDLGNGDYLLEGMKFSMEGWWIVEFDISAGGESDTVKFNLQP